MNAAVKHPVPISEPTLKDAMRQVASGVCVITTGVGEERTGDGDVGCFAVGRPANDDRLRQPRSFCASYHQIASSFLH
jgi:hypothetical protein